LSPEGWGKKEPPEKWRINSWFFLHDNAPAHKLVLVMDFLAKNYVTTLEHTPYSCGLASADFFVPSTEINIEGAESL
jgi:hypothetical protein